MYFLDKALLSQILGVAHIMVMDVDPPERPASPGPGPFLMALPLVTLCAPHVCSTDRGPFGYRSIWFHT